MPEAPARQPQDRLPHRAPFRFLTSVERLEVGISGTGSWELTGQEDFFRGHFPGDPVVPGVLIGEALAQLAGLVGLHAESSPGDRPNGGRLVHIDIRFDQPIVPPATVHLSATLTRELGPLRQFDVSAEVAKVRVARGMLTLAQVGGGAA